MQCIKRGNDNGNWKNQIDFGLIDEASSKEIAGRGLSVLYEGKELLLGSAKLMEEKSISFAPVESAGTVVYAALEGKYLGAVVISDVP